MLKKKKYYADTKPETAICPSCRAADMKVNYWYVDAGASTCNSCGYRVEKRRLDGRIQEFGWFPDSESDKLDLLTTKYDRLDPYSVLD